MFESERPPVVGIAELSTISMVLPWALGTVAARPIFVVPVDARGGFNNPETENLPFLGASIVSPINGRRWLPSPSACRTMVLDSLAVNVAFAPNKAVFVFDYYFLIIVGNLHTIPEY
jgi:hypothetical protein